MARLHVPGAKGGEMDAWQPVLVLLGVVIAGLGAVYGLGIWLAADRTPLEAAPFSPVISARPP